MNKPKTKKVKKYKYTRKECNKEIETIKRIFSGSQIMPGGWLETVAQYLHATQLMLLAQKEDRKEHAYFTSPIFHEKTITTPSPLELPKINNNFSSMEQYNWAKQITDEVNKLYQLIKEKL